MVADKGRFLPAKAEILQELRQIKDIVKDSEKVLDKLLNEGSAPGSGAETGGAGSRVKLAGQFLLLRFAQLGRTTGMRLSCNPRFALVAILCHPSPNGAFVDAQKSGNFSLSITVLYSFQG